MAEEIAEKFENAMKIGFISALILIVLEKNPSYGYNICKLIERRTLGIWNPPSSTMYTVLKDMTGKGLISFIEKQVGGRNRKIYEVTPKGRDTLKIMLEKHNIIEESIENLKTAMLGDEKGVLPKGFHKIGPFDLILNRLDEKSDKEKLEYLELQKLRFSQDQARLNMILQRIEENITLLKKKLDNKRS
ncbi:MAG: PadR family transcriptional regulator [Promethearchaeota archaeon]|jgi:DNA-binding PadR family transcriptional regulator